MHQYEIPSRGRQSCTVIMESKPSGSKPQLNYLLLRWPKPSSFISINFCFFIYIMVPIVLTYSEFCKHDQWQYFARKRHLKMVVVAVLLLLLLTKALYKVPRHYSKLAVLTIYIVINYSDSCQQISRKLNKTNISKMIENTLCKPAIRWWLLNNGWSFP